MENFLDNKSDDFKFVTSFSLDIRAWSTETQTNIDLFLYKGVSTHSALLADEPIQPFAGVLKNFAILKGKHLSWSLFLIKLQALSPVVLLKRDPNSGVFLRILRNF